jgi:hypothetical protein
MPATKNAGRQPKCTFINPPTTYPRAEPTGMAQKKMAITRPRLSMGK